MEDNSKKIIKQKNIFEQIADYYIEQILLGEFSANDRFPSAQTLGSAWGVNPNTAWRSLALLSNGGFIYNKRGLGYFVSEDAFDKAYNGLKESFVNDELPTILRKMQILNVDISALK